MSAANYIFLPSSDALRWFKVLAVFRFATSQGQQPGFELPPDRMPLRVGPRHQNTTILLVDDQALLREAIGEFLAMQGYEVKSAESGARAMFLLEDGLRPDLLLCDAVLPDIHGPALAREARLLLPDLHVLFISGHPAESFSDELGPAEFLQKPFRLDVLAHRIRALLEQSRLQ
jgi:DNA-binding NtrC family response regulator